MVLTQLEIPIETVSYLAELCAREGVPLVLDPAPAASLPRDLLPHVTWFTPNETEAAFYLRELAVNTRDLDPAQTAHALQSAGVQGVVLKLGSQGAFVGRRRTRGVCAVPSRSRPSTAHRRRRCILNGAFATGLMMTKTIAESARFAAAAAAISVTRVGAQPAMPTLAEVDGLLQSGA